VHEPLLAPAWRRPFFADVRLRDVAVPRPAGAECELCRETEKQGARAAVHLKDINPRKPNRWLTLPLT
jgi:hypothetical protein